MLPNQKGSTQQRQQTGEETALLSASQDDEPTYDLSDLDHQQNVAAVVRRMKFQIWAGALSGLAIATAIGAAFIAIVSLIPFFIFLYLYNSFTSN
jgi:hypothetical protein